jgi:phosphomannomutase
MGLHNPEEMEANAETLMRHLSAELPRGLGAVVIITERLPDGFTAFATNMPKELALQRLRELVRRSGANLLITPEG